ncbi:MAG: hypothetical protein Q8916_06295 [Bacteroidota bacterium]|nr:hypothetical protein [Bacteroidota bacterium]MDP4230000.1 hypothetical protein [Bacteroidota bacterium]MDP4236482.1 hypothetical protein [Bacteroidota bacterium]
MKIYLHRALPCVLLLMILFTSRLVLAQGGPPMLTDDSGVPGDGKWETNFALEYEGSKNDNTRSFPIVDLNYGIGERIQLKAEFTWTAEKGDNLANRFDNITLGFKYRIFDEKKDGVSLSAYPQPIISFNPEEEGTKSPAFGIFLPIAISKEILDIDVNVQAGYQILATQKQWILGICLGHEFGESFNLLAELHTTFSRSTTISLTGEDEIFFRGGTFVNIGSQIKLSETYGILAGIGKDLETSGFSSPNANYYAYVGLQLLM